VPIPSANQPDTAREARFSLHVGTVCQAHERTKLERLCRYIARPPVANDRLAVNDRGQVIYRLKQSFRDGTTHVVLDPLNFISRLTALVPRPRANLTRYHGVFAPHFSHRAAIVPQHNKRTRTDSDAPTAAPLTWMQRLYRVFAIDPNAARSSSVHTAAVRCASSPVSKILTSSRRFSRTSRNATTISPTRR